MAGVGTVVTIEDLRQRLVLYVRLNVAEHAEAYADEVLDRLAQRVQRGETDGAPAQTLCLQALAIARLLVWDAKLHVARGEPLGPSAAAHSDESGRASARAALSAALSGGAEPQETLARPTTPLTRAELRDLLLHRLPELDAQRIEEQLLLDRDVAAALQAEETDLLDDFSADRLTGDERKDVERFVLTSPAARQRVKIGRALHDGRKRRVGRSDPEKTVAPWNRWSLRAAGAIVVCMLAVAFYLAATDDDLDATPMPTSASHPHPRQAQVRVEVELAPAVATPDDPNSEEASAPFNVLLLADQQSDGAYPLSLTGDAVDVRLQAEAPFGDLSKRYRLAVQDEAGKLAFIASSLQAREAGGMVIVETLIPARSLAAGVRKVVLSPAASRTAVATWQIDVQRDP
jgi:hypothetical protein